MFIAHNLFGAYADKTYKELEDTDYDYYLGPNWRDDVRKRTKRVSTVVSNHHMFFDPIMTPTWTEMFAYVAKAGIKNVPGIAALTIGIGSIFVDRDSGKDGYEKAA